jgi:flagellar motility protein MotE (MotC chaperone)
MGVLSARRAGVVMSKLGSFLAGLCVAIVATSVATRALPQDLKKPDGEAAKVEQDAGDSVGHFCANIAPAVGEARIAWQMKRLGELDEQIKKRIAELEAKEAEARDWVSKREDMLKKADDDIVAIYAKMRPEAASAQLIAMDDVSAAAILSKLKPSAASTILNEMDAARAAKLTDLISGTAKAASAVPPLPAPASFEASPPADGKKS